MSPRKDTPFRSSTPVKQVRFNADLSALKEAALEAMTRAYAPYSKFRVGAAIIGDDGTVFVGCNVENASYPAGMCAERAALASAIARGFRVFELIVVATEADEPTPPCGLCRQVLSELAPGLCVVSITASGLETRWPLSELLPAPFNPESMDRA